MSRGYELAQVAALNALSVVDAAVGSLDAIVIVRLVVFVASSPNFYEQHLVADGASDLLVTVLGDSGKHARAAVATPVLPLNSPVEVEMTVGLERSSFEFKTKERQ